MEKTNYEFLFDQLKFLGFGENLKTSLAEAMENNQSSFELYFAADIDGEPVHAILYFSKTDAMANFYFSGYQLAMDNKLHHFRIYKGKGVTLKEGFNMLCGRAVFKQLTGKKEQKYYAWLQLDLNSKEGECFKMNTYYENYSFDMSKLLDQLMIEPPSPNWDRAMLLRSLERGNLQAALIKENGKLKNVMIEANPVEKTITIRENILQPEIFHRETDDIENVLKNKNIRQKKLKEL